MMKHKIVLILLFLPLLSLAQQPMHYWGKPAEFIEEQTRQTFELVQELIEESPPSTELSSIRKSALMHLDWIFHDPRLDTSRLTEQFLTRQIRNVVEGLQEPVTTGVKVFKMYNHGFIVKSPTVTIAFDITRAGQGNKAPMISDALMDTIAQQCDVLFISHVHGDHADGGVADLFLKHNKDIVASSGIWADKGAGITHIRSEKVLHETISLASGKELEMTVMPGHQDDTPNNVYIVSTPEGISIAHTGDQWNKEKDGWIDQVKDHAQVDILLVHCWAMPLERMVEGFDPNLVISGHENEIVHSIDHREPYWLNYRRMEKVTKPIVYMTWGEHFHFDE
ncbi:MAG: MBL fold metallo-hydrolase [Sphingobacterium sp.]